MPVKRRSNRTTCPGEFEFGRRFVDRPEPRPPTSVPSTPYPFTESNYVCGSATVANGQSLVTVTELDTTVPFDTARFILVPMSDWGGSAAWWIEPTSLTPTSFEIHTDVVVNADFDFTWWAIRCEPAGS